MEKGTKIRMNQNMPSSLLTILAHEQQNEVRNGDNRHRNSEPKISREAALFAKIGQVHAEEGCGEREGCIKKSQPRELTNSFCLEPSLLRSVDGCKAHAHVHSFVAAGEESVDPVLQILEVLLKTIGDAVHLRFLLGICCLGPGVAVISDIA